MTSKTKQLGKTRTFVAHDPAPPVFIQQGRCGARQGNARMKSRLRHIDISLTVILGLTLSLAGGARCWAGAHERVAAPAAALTSGSPTPAIGLDLGFAMADFTGDTHPDLATVELNRSDSANAQYLIEIQLTEGGHQSLKLTAPLGGLLITPKDVTGDGNLDLVIRATKSRVPVAIFLNDGFGHFSPAAPAEFSQALREAPYELACRTDQSFFSAPLISSKAYTAECRSRFPRHREYQNGSLFSANDDAPFDWFPVFGQSRAPPATA
jgi:hypothetical protein